MDDIKKIVHVRRVSGIKESSSSIVFEPPKGSTCMDEVKTVIEMPKFDAKKAFSTGGDYTKVDISPTVVGLLREYVATISSLYHEGNPFHNCKLSCDRVVCFSFSFSHFVAHHCNAYFTVEHACHVTMSVKKVSSDDLAAWISVILGSRNLEDHSCSN